MMLIVGRILVNKEAWPLIVITVSAVMVLLENLTKILARPQATAAGGVFYVRIVYQWLLYIL